MPKLTMLNLLPWLLLTIAIGSRAQFLDADPYPHYLTADWGYHVDEGYKTLAPRNLIQRGSPRVHLNDQYRGWMDTSPATQWPYYLAFTLSGETSLRAPRMVSLGYFFLFGIALIVFLCVRRTKALALVGVAIVVTDIGIFHFSRSTLFEIAIILFAYASLFIAFSVRRASSRFIVPLTLCVGMLLTALLVKLSAAIYLLPAIAALLVADFCQTRPRIRSFGLVCALLASFLVLTLDIWLPRVDFDLLLTAPWRPLVNHMHELSPTMMAIGIISAIVLIRAHGVSVVVQDQYQLALIAIVVCSPLVLGLFAYHPPRYYVPVLPAAALLTVEALAAWHSRWEGPSCRLDRFAIVLLCIPLAVSLRGLWVYFAGLDSPMPFVSANQIDPLTQYRLLLVLMVLLLFLLPLLGRPNLDRIARYGLAFGICVHLVLGSAAQFDVLSKPSFDARSIRNYLEQIVNDDELVAGDWAPFFTVGTEIRGMYMNRRVNRAEGIESVKPDYLLHATSADDVNLAIISSQGTKADDPILLGRYYQRDISLYRLNFD